MDELLDVIRNDLQNILNDSGEVIDKSYRNRFEHALNSDSFWPKNRRPFKERFSSARNLEDLRGKMRHYRPAGPPEFDIVYDPSKFDELGELESKGTASRLRALYGGESARLQQVFPALEKKLDSSDNFAATKLFDRSGSSSSGSSSIEQAWILQPNSELLPEAAFLHINVEKIPEQNKINVALRFQEFNLEQ